MQEKAQTSTLPRIGISHGDINGIAYETILKAFADTRMLSAMTPVLYGQSKVLSYYKKNFGIEDFNYSLTRDVRQAWNQKFNIINIVERELKIDPGTVTPVSAEMAVTSLKMAIEDLRSEYLDALVMAPSCHSVESTQTDYLSAMFGKPDMLRVLLSDFMRVGLATEAIPLRDALAMLNADFIVRKLTTFSRSLSRDFGLNQPKIAVMGLDPHSGRPDNVNEKETVTKAVVEAQKLGVYAFGPFSATTLFVSGAWKKYDAILALTYNQGVLPFKLISVNGYATYWAGLPMVCTAPAHGPAFDIANANQASPESLRKALFFAIDIVNNRLAAKGA